METVSNSDSEPVSNLMACPLRMSVFLKELKCYGDLSIWILGFVSNFEFRYSDLYLLVSDLLELV